MIGTIVDSNYRVKSRIGEGGFGVVYECEEIPLQRTVALKMVSRDKASERELKRFMSEARNMASLNHPNVVQIYHLGEHEGNPYIAMEYLRGKTLRELARHHPLKLKQALGFVHQVATGMQAIHDRGILHHDISPNNILVTESGTAKILDLGMSRDLSNLSTFDSQNYLVGTVAYLAPEQIEGKGSSFQAEVFSVGVILYELLAGRHPFWAEHPMSQLFNVVHRDPEPIETYLPGCPSALAQLVLRSLRKNPAERFQSMRDFAECLAALIQMSGPDYTVTPTLDPVMRSPTATPRNPYLSRVMIKRREDFFGRHHEVQRIYARLNASPPGSISLVGERKIGKSSLLNYVYMRPNRQIHLESPDTMVMVFLDLQSEMNMSMPSFVRTLIEMAQLELRGRMDVSDCKCELEGVRDLVQRLDAGGFRLTVLLDEFDSVTTNPHFDLQYFSFLRFLANHYNVAYITSSSRDLQSLCHAKEIADSPFFNIFSTMRLSVFQRSEAEELVRVPSERVGKPLASYTDEILDMAGLFPFYIQMACSHCLEYLDENPGTTAPDFNTVRRGFYEEASMHYRYIWDSLDEHQRSALIRVASGKNIPDALQHVIDELEKKHYIEKSAGKGKLFASAFRDFVRGESRTGAPSVLGRIFGR